MYQFLANAPLLAGLEADDLDHLGSRGTERNLAAEETLFVEGAEGDACYFVMEGMLAITKRSGEQDVLITKRGPGEVVGEMALIDGAPRSASVYAEQPSRLFVVDKQAFQDLLAASPTAALNTLHTFAHRLRESQAALHQNEKMAALGTMTAGVAHELNNPAAAARRAAEQLGQTLGDLQQASLDIDTMNLGQAQWQSLRALRDELETRAASPAQLDMITRSDRESKVEDWLSGQGIEPAWELAPLLVTAGFDTGALAGLAGDFAAGELAAVIRWLGTTYTSFTLLGEIRSSTGRLSEIVRAMKQYAYLDQAPVQEVDVHEGIENTLVILGHKLRDGVNVVRDYADDLPRITAYASELTQVWTNLLDNAIDAMNGKGTLHIRTSERNGNVVVEVTDDGPGIPDSVLPRLFDPFFTTKAPGEGTGLGLHISHSIVVNKHDGQIEVTSAPGETTFAVWLPIVSNLS